MKDIALKILSQMLSHSPERSYARLNPALRSTLKNCILADLPFPKNTFRNIYYKLRGGRWFGDGAGSSIGEHFYTVACGANHASACQSFEAFAKRPGVLWENDATTPRRLHVGADLFWKGYHLTVTSMRSDSLVACSRDRKRRFTVPYTEIAEYRRTAKKRIKQALKDIETADFTAPGAREELVKRINAYGLRHFELEQINAAFDKRKEQGADAARVEAWRNGQGDPWLETKAIYLRRKDDRIDCSNGNSVAVAAVREIRHLIIARQRNGNHHGPMGLQLDGYQIKATSDAGVQVGCTLIPWSEVEYVIKQLN